MLVDSPYQQARLARLRKATDALLKQAAGRVQANASSAWRREITTHLRRHADGWSWLTPRAVATGPDESAQARGDVVVLQDKRDSAKASPARQRSLDVQPGPGWLTALRIDLPARPEHLGRALRSGGAAFTARNALRVSVKVTSAGGAPSVDLAFAFADAAGKAIRYDNGAEAHGVLDGWVPLASGRGNTQQATFQLAEPRPRDRGPAAGSEAAGHARRHAGHTGVEPCRVVKGILR